MSHLASYGIRRVKLLLRMSLLIKINNIMRFRYAPHLRGNFLFATRHATFNSTTVANTGVLECFPSLQRGFDSLRPLQILKGLKHSACNGLAEEGFSRTS